jgi:hypothetical protein
MQILHYLPSSSHETPPTHVKSGLPRCVHVCQQAKHKIYTHFAVFVQGTVYIKGGSKPSFDVIGGGGGQTSQSYRDAQKLRFQYIKVQEYFHGAHLLSAISQTPVTFSPAFFSCLNCIVMFISQKLHVSWLEWLVGGLGSSPGHVMYLWRTKHIFSEFFGFLSRLLYTHHLGLVQYAKGDRSISWSFWHTAGGIHLTFSSATPVQPMNTRQ